MADPFFGEIRMMAFDYPPMDWAYCNGQSMPIQQAQALYAVIGMTYGGSGTNFNLPNLQQRVAMGMGAGAGLTPRVIGKTGGDTTVTLTESQMPSHSHAVNAVAASGTTSSPLGAKIAQGRVLSGSPPTQGRKLYNAMPAPANAATLASGALSPFVGGGSAHGNLQPSLTLNFCISLDGYFPVKPS